MITSYQTSHVDKLQPSSTDPDLQHAHSAKIPRVVYLSVAPQSTPMQNMLSIFCGFTMSHVSPKAARLENIGLSQDYQYNHVTFV